METGCARPMPASVQHLVNSALIAPDRELAPIASARLVHVGQEPAARPDALRACAVQAAAPGLRGAVRRELARPLATPHPYPSSTRNSPARSRCLHRHATLQRASGGLVYRRANEDAVQRRGRANAKDSRADERVHGRARSHYVSLGLLIAASCSLCVWEGLRMEWLHAVCQTYSTSAPQRPIPCQPGSVRRPA